MGDLHRHYSVMQAGWNVVNCSYYLYWEKNVYPNTCAVGVATQSAHVPAFVMRFCVQLLL